MRVSFFWLLGALVLGMSACTLERSGLGPDERACPPGGSAAVCDASGEQLVGCVGATPTSEACPLGCTPGAASCWVCDPSDTTRLCSSTRDAVEGCGADGAPSSEHCLSGCEAGGSACNPCMDGAVVCDPVDGSEVLRCAGGSEVRTPCEFLCNDSGAGDPHCNDCPPSTVSCQAGAIVSCGADGLALSSTTCDIGCELVEGIPTCQLCAPSTSRCDGDLVLTCDAAGTTEAPSATCPAGACIEDGAGGATCGSCVPGTTRCDGAGTATIACGADAIEEPPAVCGADRHCEPDAGGVTASCVPNCVDGCEGDVRVTCAGGEVRETCALGCDATTGCEVLLPSNVGSVTLDRGTSGLSVGTTGPEFLIFDTDEDGRIDRYDPATGARTLLRAAATDTVDAGIYHERLDGAGSETPGGASIPDLAVWVMDSLTVGAQGTLYFVGTRAAVLLVDGDVMVAGRINARAEWLRDTDGSPFFMRAPAGAFGASGEPGLGFGGGAEGLADGNRRAGGGGGSFGSQGGQGGGAGFGAPASPAGPLYGDADLVPLYGGSAGGAGADDIAAGGDGGGALQISAGGTLSIAAGAIVDTSGEGGYGASGDRGGGGGGGSGGAILLEAAVIAIEGVVGAPGGGGAGGSRNAADGARGSRWDPPAETRGLRGAGAGTFGGDGGHGSDEAGGRGADGQTINDPNGGAGGGGGGAGRVRLNVRPGTTPTVTGVLVPSGPLSSQGEVGLR